MENLYKIGEVADICNVTIRTLRYYEELGLITPTNVDIYTGYRYYDEENVKKIKQILMLKDLNFSLDEIKNMSDDSILYKQVQLENQIKDLKRKIRFVSSLKIFEICSLIVDFDLSNNSAICACVSQTVSLSYLTSIFVCKFQPQ